ncbi:uncharacterized protein K452DRAFT_363203 [Aplosporella prunicola CBS 121167]|uniref:Uncharacterized protein n=1 Tax=Aplosporella prunicola CBS 121167 TaxID=1176127 RepID=A0A6A6AWN2_9PEZI|nr:uncharacterized protein K452DRAFT_363203 [Aplosporella prunicola CBS 121167]KAF2135385.1 hypothetical protein K452DRAFT_363203 [Aplosporella prunicola CBS 121167]
MFRMSNKRPREDDDDDPTVHHDKIKKHRVGEAPQRAHPPVPPFLNLHHHQIRSPSYLPPALTPGQSDDSGCDSPDLPPYMAASAHSDTDMQDCYEDDFNMLRSNPNSPALPFMLPERLNPRLPTDSTGRIPTPIYGSFPPASKAALPRGSSDISTMELEEPPTPTTTSTSTSSFTRGRGRRMPSPISENESSVATPTSEAGSRLSRLRVSADEGMDVDMPSPASATGSGFSSPRLHDPRAGGRSRSGAITTGKKKFFMGFRDDCPKCLAKVPGHNAHFLPL